MAEASQEDQEAEQDERIGERSADEDEGVGPGHEVAELSGVLQPSAWADAYEVQGERDQEHDEPSHSKRTCPPPYFQVVHKKLPLNHR